MKWANILAACGLALTVTAGCQRRSEYPNRPIVLICPWSAGGGTDRISRQIAMQLEQELGVPVNVVNATGGGGVTGHTRGALADADGYTLTTITPELNMLHWRGMTNVTYKDFDPLMLINRDEPALFVSADAPWQSLPKLTEDIRSHPGNFKASGTSFGGIWHLSLAGWLIEEKIDPAAVPWKSISGSAPSLQELISGGVDMVCCSVPEALPLLEAKKVRCLGIMAKQRLPGMEHIHTFQEQGVPWTHQGWRGLALPRGVPSKRREKLLKAIDKIVTGEDYKQFLRHANFGHAAEPPAEFAKSLKEDDAIYGKMFADPAFKSVQSQRFGPTFFPAALGILLLVCLLGVVVTGQWRASAGEPLTKNGLLYLALSALWVVVFLVALPWAGFVVTGVALLVVLLYSLRVHWALALIVPLVLVPAVYQLFAVYLRVPLPWGLLGWN